MDIYANWNIDIDNADTDDDPATGTDDPWDFGTSGQYPALQVDFDGNGTATADEFGSQRTTHFLSMRYMFDIALGISVGSEVETVVAVPSDFNNTLSYTISSQTLNGAAVSYFVIANTAIGTISVADPAPTEVGSYTLSVEVSDGVGGTATTEVIINLLLLMSEGEFTACSGKFMDTGGSGDYGSDEDITMTISPQSAADRVRVEFTSFHVEGLGSCAYDGLEVYNGATRSATLIGIYCDTNSPGVVLSSSADGKLTFYFKSDDTGFFSGWEATISCVPAVSVAPVVSSFTPTSGLVGATVMITGVGFSTTAAENTVTFLGEAGAADNAVVMTVSAATATELSVTVPSSAVTGKIQVAVNSVVAVSSDDFTVLMSVPPTDTDDDELINITTLTQLDAIRYDLDGNGVVSFTTAASLTGSPMFSNRTAVVAVMGDTSAYAEAFASGDFYTAADGIVAATGAVAASTTYYYKLSSAATSPYTGYELMNNLDFEDADGNGTADDKSIWAEGASGAGVPDAVAEGWAPIGYYNNNGTPSNSSDDVDVSFTNTFEGNAYKISNLYINRDANYVGLFGCLGETSTLRDLGVENVSVTSTSTNSNTYAGGLVGRNDRGTITDCYSTGTVTGGEASATNLKAYALTGGLVGRNDSGTITNCYSSGTVTGRTATTTGGDALVQTGGLVGRNDDGTITNCYSSGTVTGGTATVSTSAAVTHYAVDLTGGLVGDNEGGTIIACYSTVDITGGTATVSVANDAAFSRAGGLSGSNFEDGTITACYSTGTIAGGTATGGSMSAVQIGGLVGISAGAGCTIEACYSTGAVTGGSPIVHLGGLVGFDHGTTSNSYFDGTENTGITNAIGQDANPSSTTNVSGKITTELQMPVAYGTGMDIYANWNIDVDNADTDDDPATGTDDPWDFGTSSQYPALKVDFNGDGTPSAAEFGGQGRAAPTTPATVPAAPSALTAAAANAAVTLSWAAPASDGGAPIINYMVEYDTDMNFSSSPTTVSTATAATSHTVSTLTNATPYYFRVAAVNSVGTGAYYPGATDDAVGATPVAPATVPDAPEVSSFTPEMGVVSTTVMIIGIGFSTTAAENTVTFLGEEANDADNVEAIVSTSPAPTAASLTVTVPADAQTGKISVMVGTAADTSAGSFTVSSGPAVLTVSDFTPTSGAVGETVMITGTGFSTTAAENTVTFLGSSSPGDEQTATVNTARATELTVTVPVGAMTGKIQVEVNSVMAVSSDDFTVLMLVPPTDTDANGLIDITTLAQLDAIRYDLDGDGRPTSAGQTAWQTAFSAVAVSDDDAAVRDASTGFTGYELMNSLDFDNVSGSPSIWSENCTDGACQTATAVDGDNADKVGWAPIGYYNSSTDNAPYTATFEGNSHTISNLYIDRSSANGVGLFGLLGTGSNVRNLGIEGGSVTGKSFVGGFVGWNNGGTISACYATGNASGSGFVGGLVGNNNNGAISACYATGNASGIRFVGGLAGTNGSGTISACYATGNALGVIFFVGGLVGSNGGTISACYATGNVDGGTNVGGLVGDGSGSSSTVTNSYFGSSVSNRHSSDPYAKTTAQLQTPTAYGTAMDIYANWNIDVDNGQPIGVDDGTAAGDPTADNPWDFGTDMQYPALQVDFDRDGTASVAEFGNQPRTVLFGVFSFTPTSGVVGATVTIRGRLFSATATDNAVVFLGAEGDETDNVMATVSAATTTSLTMSVPPAAQTGKISVMVGSAADTSAASFTVHLSVPPTDTDADGLIDITTLEQLDAIRYDLNGDGVVSFTTADPLPAAADFSDRNDVLAVMGDTSAYAEAFASGDFYTAVDATAAATGAVAASTTYYYKLSSAATSPYTGYELMNNLDFEDANGDGTADDKSIWAEGATAAGVPDAVAEGWKPIGDNSTRSDATRFTATFEGNGHTISNLYINRPSTAHVGLFGDLGPRSNVRNLGIEGGSVTGDGFVGGLVGYNSGGTISACYATGDASGSGSGNGIGGLMGTNLGGTISACYATGDASGFRAVGGLVGSSNGTISACYATGNVSVSTFYVGGLVGVASDGSTISACYATGNVSGPLAGGLVGATSNTGTVVTNSYFDSTVSNRPVTDDYAKTTAELQTPTAYGTAMDIYADWNIDVDSGQPIGVDDGTEAGDAAADNPWDFGTDMQYPALQVDFDRDGTASVAEFGNQPRTVLFGVSSFTPTSGVVGATVTIRGRAFSTTATENTVTFLGAEGDETDNKQATVSAATASSLTVSVPTDAQTGKISVMVGTAADTSEMSFRVLDPNVLAITGINPTSAAVGTSVTISGQHFSTTAAENTVTFLGGINDNTDNQRATVSAATAASLTVTVPADAQTGKISVMVGTAADTSAASFTVTGTTPAAPVVSSFSPTEGEVDTEVTITGVNFSDMSSENEVRFGGVMAADPTSASTTSLVVLVPSGAVTGRVSVTVGGQTGTSSENFTVEVPAPAPAAPVVSSFSPTEGVVDTEVTITGVNFSDVPSENDVRFGGVMAAAPTSASTTSLVVLVPSGAVTGRVSVAVGGQTGTSSESFTVTVPAPAPAPPVVLSFSPIEGAVDTEVTITGENFSDMPSENEVRFGGVMAADPTSASTTSLTVRVPSGAVTGRVSVAVGGQTGTSSENFTVTGTTPAPAPPVVLSFSPSEGVVGTSVIITGENFSDMPSENEVRFGGVMAAAPTSASTTSLTVRVPSGAVTGRVSVAVGGQTGTSSEDFTVTVPAPAPDPPVVLSFSPSEGVVGTEVTITGVNFSDVPSENDLRFGGVMAADPTSASTTSLTVLVPSGARTGSISVAVGGQTGTSSEDFTVTGTTPVSPFSVPLSSEGDVRLYPNPTSGYLHFKGLLAGGRYVCDLYSLVGQKVLSSIVRAGDTMDISTLSSGQYILILQAEGRELMRTRLLVVR